MPFALSGTGLARLALASLFGLQLVASASAQTPLPVGAPQQGKVSSDTPTEYTLVAKTAGVLVAAVQGDGDLALLVTDADGQTMPDGTADRDMNGSEGTEMVSMMIPEPGTYKLRVRLQGGQTSTYTISGSWMSFPAFARANPDPDRRPSAARSAAIGKPHEDSLNGASGDMWDWFSMKPAQAGTLVVVTRRLGEGDGDLVVEVFLGGDYSQPAGRSDQDLQGNNANESVTVNVEAGQAVHVKVSANSSSVNTKYRLSSNLIP